MTYKQIALDHYLRRSKNVSASYTSLNKLENYIVLNIRKPESLVLSNKTLYVIFRTNIGELIREVKYIKESNVSRV